MLVIRFGWFCPLFSFTAFAIDLTERFFKSSGLFLMYAFLLLIKHRFDGGILTSLRSWKKPVIPHIYLKLISDMLEKKTEGKGQPFHADFIVFLRKWHDLHFIIMVDVQRPVVSVDKVVVVYLGHFVEDVEGSESVVSVLC